MITEEKLVNGTPVEGLRHGDQTRIAIATGYTRDYVQKVLTGRRYNRKVIAAARLLVSKYEEIKAEISSGHERQN